MRTHTVVVEVRSMGKVKGSGGGEGCGLDC